MRQHSFSLLLVFLACASASEPVFDQTPLQPTPWPATFPRDFTKDPLTAADWVGPDGIIYPDWSWAGVHRGKPGQRSAGIPPDLAVVETISAELAGAGKGQEFTDALATAIATWGAKGGGVIALPAGTFYLVRPLVIPYDRVVLRGAGRGQAVEVGGRNDPVETRIRFDFGFGGPGQPMVDIQTYPDGYALNQSSRIVIHAQAFSASSSVASQQPSGKQSHIHSVLVRVTPKGKPAFTYAITRDQRDQGKYDRWQRLDGGGPAMSFRLDASKLPELATVSEVALQPTVIRRWQEGKQAKEDQVIGDEITFDCSGFSEPLPYPLTNLGNSDPIHAALTFSGDSGPSPARYFLKQGGKRGDATVIMDCPTVEEAIAKGFVPGAPVVLGIGYSRTWHRQIERDAGASWGLRRDQWSTVRSVKAVAGGVEVSLEQVLQLDFPFNEGEVEIWNEATKSYDRNGDRSSRIRLIRPIQECGVENLVLEQTQPIWFNGISMNSALNCWLKNVRVERAGRNPITIEGAMNEIRDSEFMDPRWANNTGQGSAYVSGSTFGLIDNIYTRNCRHAPNFSSDTNGVVRNSRFFSSDLQWHMAWGRNHLIENCTVDALEGTGSYGWAAFAQRNITDIHGPGQGPRNVIYNCDLIGVKGGIFLGGKTENPLLLHNRIRTWSGPGVALRYHIFNGVILGNVIALQNRFEPGVLFGDPERDQSRLAKPDPATTPPVHPGLGAANPGNDFLDNTVYGGSGVLAEGIPEFGKVRSPWRRSGGNRSLPWQIDPPRPTPAMASVFATQRANPKGFAAQDPTKTLYAQIRGDDVQRNDGTALVQVNFQEEKLNANESTWQMHGDERVGEAPGKGWSVDSGKPFGPRDGGLSFGWTGGTPRMYYEGINRWTDQDVRNRTCAEWMPGEVLEPARDWKTNQELAWSIELEPATYRVYLSAGNPSSPKRFTSDEQPLPFRQVNSFLVNNVLLSDPGQSDVRRDAYWTTVTVGADRRLTIRPAPDAITPKLSFVQIYTAAP